LAASPAATKPRSHQNPALPNPGAQESHLNSHVNVHSYQQPPLSTATAINSLPRAYQLATLPARASQPPPCASQVAATCSCLPPRAFPNRSYQLALSIVSIRYQTLKGLFLAPTSSRLPTRGDELAPTDLRHPSRSYRLPPLPACANRLATTGCRLANRDPQLPARAIHLAATGCRHYQLALTAS
jgi:hypothetical protein